MTKNLNPFSYLVCPLSHEILHYDQDRQALISKKAKLVFPIRDNIPIMVVSEAKIFDETM